MNKVILDDIMGLPAYEKVREKFRQRRRGLHRDIAPVGVFSGAARSRWQLNGARAAPYLAIRVSVAV